MNWPWTLFRRSWRKEDEVPPSRVLLYIVLSGTLCYADLRTKQWAFTQQGMPGERPVTWLWENFIGLETSLNRGALFGLGQNGVLYFAAFSTVAALGVMAWFVVARVGRSATLTIVASAVTGGILGNLYDRLGLWSLGDDGWPTIHAVRDWIRLSYYQHVWPNFNVADSLLVCSAAYLAFHSFFATSPSTPLPSTSATTPLDQRSP